MKAILTVLTLLAALLLAGGAHAQIPAMPVPDAFTVTSNALQAAIAKGDASRITMLSNALLRITGQAAARPAVPATPAPPVARPANPVVAPANPAGVPPPVAGAVAPAAGGGVPPATAAAAKAAAAITGDPDEVVFQPGMLKLNDADVSQVLEIYQDLTGRTILRPATLPATTKITLKSQSALTRREAIQALDSILSMNQITMIPQGEKFMKALPQAEAFTGAGPFNDTPAELLPDSGTFVTEIIQLKNTTPQDLQQLLAQFAKLPGNSIIGIPGANMLVIRDYAENVKRMVEIIERVDVMPIQEFEPVVIPIKYALVGDIAQVLSGLTEGGSTTSVGSSGSGSSGRGLSGGGMSGGGMGSRGGMGGMGGVGGMGGYGGAGGMNTGMNAMGGLNQTGMGASGIGGAGGMAAGGARNSFADKLRSIVNKAATGTFAILGQTQIIADERTNSLLIFANKQDLISISNIINKLDIVLAQVLIEAAIIQVRLKDTVDLGISYLQKPKSAGNWTGAGAVRNDTIFQNPSSLTSLGTNLTGGFSYFLRFNETLDMALKAAADDSRFNVLARPRIQTSHAVQADIFVGETRPYPTGTSYGGYGGNYSQVQQLQIGISLSVLPLINADGLVSMDIRTSISQPNGTVKIDNVGDVPIITSREANAKVAVRDRETVMLGGFISDDSDRSKSGVPILKDLPLLGGLFRSSSKTENRIELIIMIRPTVLPSPEIAALVAKEESGKMPGVVATERMFKENVENLRKSEGIETSKPKKSSESDLFKREGLTP